MRGVELAGDTGPAESLPADDSALVRFQKRIMSITDELGGQLLRKVLLKD